MLKLHIFILLNLIAKLSIDYFLLNKEINRKILINDLSIKMDNMMSSFWYKLVFIQNNNQIIWSKKATLFFIPLSNNKTTKNHIHIPINRHKTITQITFSIVNVDALFLATPTASCYTFSSPTVCFFKLSNLPSSYTLSLFSSSSFLFSFYNITRIYDCCFFC